MWKWEFIMISMLGIETGSSVVDSIVGFLQSLLEGLDMGSLLYIFGGIMLGIILISIVRLIWCYEDRAMRAMKHINKYLKNNPKINDDNLVEFHKKMKKLPRRIRDRWQLFMLEREGSPSRYMTVEYCVKRPLYNSAITMNQKQITYASLIIAIFSLIFGLSCLLPGVETVYSLGSMILLSLIIPAIVLIIAGIYCMGLHIKYTSVNHDLYDMFTTFVRNIDKATNTMPDYVDYELLFTKKEIDKGIPVLREYLEKRAMEEQRLLEKAKKEEVNHSPYDFSSLGVNGAQLIERAVTESEKFLTNKIQLQNEITELEKQVQKSDANVEEIQRDANRKLQAIKENLERLDKAMSETTNRVEINYNRRQAEAEMEKKNLLEKDLESMLNKEKVASDALKVEIQKRKETVEENKKMVEDALKSEYDTFATKVYDELNEKITRDNSEQLHEMEMTIARLKAKIKEFTRDIEKKDSIIEARNLELDNMRQQISKQKGKGKSKKDFGQDYIKAQDNKPEGTINAVQVDYSEPQQPMSADTAGYYEPQMTDTANYNYSQPEGQPADYTQADGQPVDYSQPTEQSADYAQNQNYDYTQADGQPVDYTQPTDQQPADFTQTDGQPVDYAQADGQQPENYDYSQPTNYDYTQPSDTGFDYSGTGYTEQPENYGDYYQPTGYDENGNPIYPYYDENGNPVDANGYPYNYTDTTQPTDTTQTDTTGTTDTTQTETTTDANNTTDTTQPTDNTDTATENNDTTETTDNTGTTESTGASETTEPAGEEPKPENMGDNLDLSGNTLDLSGTSTQNTNSLDLSTPTENKEEEKTEEKVEAESEEKKEEETAKAEDEKELKPAKKPKVKKLTDEVPESKEEPEDAEDKKAEEVEEKDKDKAEEKEEKTKKKESKKDEAEEKESKKDDKKYVENDDLVALQKQIEEENARLKQQQEELRAQIDKTLASMEKAENATKAERTRNIKKIKDMIAKLKVQAEEAKAKGQSKSAINKINKSAAELLRVLAEYQAKK